MGRADQLKTILDHSDEKYQCKEMSDCPYTGTTLIDMEPWGDWPPGEDESEDSVLDFRNRIATEAGDTKEEDGGEIKMIKRKAGLLNKMKRLFRK